MQRQPHHVVKIAGDGGNQYAAAPLNAIAARLAQRFAAGEIGAQKGVGMRRHGDAAAFDMRKQIMAAAHGKTGENLMLPPGKLTQHGERFGVVLRLAENGTVAGNDRIGGDDERIGKIGGDRFRLGAGQTQHQLRRSLPRLHTFINGGFSGGEIKAEHLQEESAAGGSGGEDDLHKDTGQEHTGIISAAARGGVAP